MSGAAPDGVLVRFISGFISAWRTTVAPRGLQGTTGRGDELRSDA